MAETSFCRQKSSRVLKTTRQQASLCILDRPRRCAVGLASSLRFAWGLGRFETCSGLTGEWLLSLFQQYADCKAVCIREKLSAAADHETWTPSMPSCAKEALGRLRCFVAAGGPPLANQRNGNTTRRSASSFRWQKCVSLSMGVNPRAPRGHPARCELSLSL